MVPLTLRNCVACIGACLVIILTFMPSLALACEGAAEEEAPLEFGPKPPPVKIPEEPASTNITIKNSELVETLTFVLNNTEKLPFKRKSTTCGATLAPLEHCEDAITVETGTATGTKGDLVVAMENKPLNKKYEANRYQLEAE